jgi:Domain of Unknown Function (DUF1543)
MTRPASILWRMHLYAALLGGPVAAGRMGEDHEIVFVVASTPEEAKVLAKAKWTGAGRGHVDAVERLEAIDGYRISVTRSEDAADDEIDLVSYN